MKYAILLSVLFLASCKAEELYKIKYGDISAQGEFLNPKLIEYAKVAEGTYEGKYFADLSVSPAKVKFYMERNTPRLEMEVDHGCKLKFGNVKKVVVRFNTVTAYVPYSDSCNSSANLAAVVVNIDGKTQMVERVSLTSTGSGEFNALFFLSNR
jgi:hypothetical protein